MTIANKFRISARMVVVRVIVMMRARKTVMRIVGIIMRRVFVVHGVLALVFHELLVTVELMRILVFMSALVLGNREWVRAGIRIRIRRVRARRSRRSLRPRSSRHRRWRARGTSLRKRGGQGGPATASAPGGSRLPTTLEAVPEVASETAPKAEIGGLRGETWGERLRESSSAGTSLVPAKWWSRFETPRGVPSSMTVSKTRRESRGTATAKAEECTKECKRVN